MEELAKTHRAISNLASYLNKERNEYLFFQDGGLTLNIPSNQHQRLLEDENYRDLINHYQDCGGQVVLGESFGIEFWDLAECFS